MLNWDYDTTQENSFLPDWARVLGLGRCFIYTGPSMSPTFRPGQMLYVRTGVQYLAPGDVIVLAQSIASGGYVTHRIVAVTPSGVITRGDNNARVDDGVVLSDQIIGRVEMVDDSGRIKPVLGGKRALWLAQARWGVRRVERVIRLFFGTPYRALRASTTIRSTLRRIIMPRFEYVAVQTSQGTLVKTLHRGKVVARWYPKTRRFECNKPYDLILTPPNTP
jgi:signal peptidase I